MLFWMICCCICMTLPVVYTAIDEAQKKKKNAGDGASSIDSHRMEIASIKHLNNTFT